MPKISAESVAEHVSHQRSAVLAAAVRLFIERGYGEVSLADIAAEVGLARNSLYRYVPDKVHLLVDWFRDAVPRTIDEWESAVAGDGSAAERLQRWADAYLAWAATPEHQLVAPLTEGLPQMDEGTRAEVARLHRSMIAVPSAVVAAAGVPDAEVPGVVHLLSGLVLGVARAEAEGGVGVQISSGPTLRHRLYAAIDAALA